MFLNVGLDNFNLEVLNEQRPVLLACVHPGLESRVQEEIFQGMSEIYVSALKICLLDVARVSELSEKLGIVGTPTFLIFLGGKEIGRMLGRKDKETLQAFVLRAISDSQRN